MKLATLSVSSRNSGSLKKYVCEEPDCDKSYHKPSLLEQHRRSHTNERPFVCHIENCTSLFLRKSHLKAHLVSHGKEENKPFHCLVCGKGVNTQQHLKRHEITHTKSFKCEHPGCTEAFYKHQSLRHHVLSVHERTLSCLKCDKTFSRPYRLAQHNIKFHSELPVYQCDHQGCFGNFKTWLALQLHIKTEHPKLKCPVCGKGCVGKKGLKSHMMSHDDALLIKLWNCNYCEVGQFVKKVDLISHYNEFHDANIPDDLLRPHQKEQLESLLLETDTTHTLDQLKHKGFTEMASDDDNDDLSDDESSFRKTQHSLQSFNSTVASGKSSIIDLLLSNYQTKVIPCPKNNCTRKFSRQHDLNRHLKWHELHLKKINLFLLSLEEQETARQSTKRPASQEEEPRKRHTRADDHNVKVNFKEPSEALSHAASDDNNLDDDRNLDELIDEELRLLRAGE